MVQDTSAKRTANRLIHEKSPYLLQHAYNPVDWYPWGEEAFEKARRENKLIFLSIGYSTCHWCHVMERESFENPEVAALLNADYVPVKVDREERPDVDHIYMNAIQAITGSGGWPLTVFMTPDAHPVTGGTYFPPEDKWGRQGMKSILPRLAGLWKSEREKMLDAGRELTQLLQTKPKIAAKEVDIPALFETAFKQFKNSFDEVFGGFGGAPKFPRSHDLSFLLRFWKKKNDTHALHMVEKTLTSMAHGGIYDHLGGGFARYATDERWLVPHFEKMMYDQAGIAKTYLEAYQATKNLFYAEVARDIFRYVLRDMTSPEGGFYSAEDADSEGEEGKFYVWRPEEIMQVLGKEDGALFASFFGVTDQGNFEHGTSILHQAESIESFTVTNKLDLRLFKEKLAACREKLFQVRKERIPPYKDDKILTAWNGMMISALAMGAQILNEPAYAEAARRAAEFVLKHLQQNGRLLRRFRDQQSAVPGFQDDYAFFANALLDLYETVFDVRYLEEAKRLLNEMIRLFWDETDGGFFYAGADAAALIARGKEYYDGAVPSGNSMAALLMVRILKMTDDASLEAKLEKLTASNSAALHQHPVAHPQYLSVLEFTQGPSREIVFAGDSASLEFQNLLKIVHGVFDPNRVLLYHPSNTADTARIEKIAPFTKGQNPSNGKAAVYVCRDKVCQLPVTRASDLERLLREK